MADRPTTISAKYSAEWNSSATVDRAGAKIIRRIAPMVPPAKLATAAMVSDKKIRVANFQQETIKNFVELLGAAGLDHPDQITRHHIYRRTNQYEVKRYSELFPEMQENCLTQEDTVPAAWRTDWQLADPERF